MKLILAALALFLVSTGAIAQSSSLNGVTISSGGGGGGGGTPGGTSGQIQFNNGGTFGGLSAVPISNGGTGSATGSGYLLHQVYNPGSTSLVTYGDSITAGVGATTQPQAFADLLQTDMAAAPLNNFGDSGAFACDVTTLELLQNNVGGTWTIPTARAPITTLMIGTNDANTKGVGSYETNVYKPCHQATIAWAAIPATSKVLASSAGCVQTGTWASDSTYAAGNAIKSTTNGSTLSCSITTNGGVLYAWYGLADTYTGTFTYSLDGGAAVSVNSFTSPAIAGLGTTGTALIRLTGVASGSHTLAFTVTSATGANAAVSIIGVGTTPSAQQWFGAPAVYVAGVLQQQNNAAAAATAAYNADAQADVTLLQGDGLNVRFVDVRSYVNSATQMANTLHPNDSGHSSIRDAFEAVIQFSPGFSGLLQNNTFRQNNPLANGYGFYANTNSASLASSSQMNPGQLVFGNPGLGNFAGIDLGFANGEFETRVFGTTGIVGLAMAHCVSANTSQSGCTDDLWFDTSAYNAHIRAGLSVGALTASLPVFTDASKNLTSTAPAGYSAVLSGTTAAIGGSALLAGACAAGTVTVTGAASSMVATASPSADPDSTLATGVAIYAFVSAANTVAVRVCAIVAVTPAAVTYNVRVLQ